MSLIHYVSLIGGALLGTYCLFVTIQSNNLNNMNRESNNSTSKRRVPETFHEF